MLKLKNKNCVVFGLGKSGFYSSLLLKRAGARVFATDSNDTPQLRQAAKKLKKAGIGVEIGSHNEAMILNADLIVVSPGIDRRKCKALLRAEKKGILIISEIELGFQLCPAKIVAITGTNGKSTTTTLAGRLFQDAQRRVVVCGNIGNPLSEHAADIGKDAVAVVEVSSFQLERIVHFRPKVSVILNISRNHFDRHGNLKNYAAAKARIFQNQTKNDVLILNADCPRTKALAGESRARTLFFSRNEIRQEGAFLRDGWICLRLGREEYSLCRVEEVFLKQPHNIENILAAILAGAVFNLPWAAMRKTISSFKGLEHRIEFVRRIKGVNFINDSKATSVDAAKRAIASMSGPIVLICGGRDKGNDFRQILPDLKKQVKTVVAIGEAKDRIKNIFQRVTAVKLATDLPAAVTLAYQSAENGDNILLSPMCASFDMFRDFEHRGRVFKQIVNSLADELMS